MSTLTLSINSIEALLAKNGSLIAIKDDAINEIRRGGIVIIQRHFRNDPPAIIKKLTTLDELSDWIESLVGPNG